MIRTPGVRLLAIAAMAFGMSAACRAQNVLTHHVRPVTTNGKAPFLGPVPSNQAMRLTVVLPLRNEAGLDSLLEQLYNPNSSSYHQFLTVDQFTAQFGPTQDDYNTTIQYLQESGLTISGTSRNRLNINVTGPASAVEAAFHVKLGLYQHDTENRSFYAPDREPTVGLPFPLWHISGLDNYSTPHPAGLDKRPAGSGTTTANATTGSGPSASFLGSDMRAAYYGDASTGATLTGSGQSLGLLEYYGTDLTDLNTYFSNVHQTNSVPITLLSTDGTSTSCVYSRFRGCDDTEQTLDLTQALGMAPGLSSLVMYVGSSDSAIFNAMATANPLNAQLSSSWTWSPADPSTADPYFKEFAAQGQNLFQAAGDSGAWTSGSSVYPADDVYVTTVGGTDLVTSSAGGPWSSETAWSSGGGGISPSKFALPSWQTAVAAGCSSCSQSYRNGPDVSANSNYTFYVCADQTTCTANQYGGTSFAAPMWAGYLALVNQQSVANGGKPLGFINPALYTIGGGSSYDTDFHDVTSGSNGFSATTGYDLATGWGSPNGSALVSALTGSSTTTAGYTLSASPTSVSVVQGNSGSSTITSTVSGGFNSAVNLSASGQPSGVTVTFSPSSSITGTGSVTMNMAVGSTVSTGTYTITVTGTSGSTVETTTVSLTITAAQTGSFSLSASPTSVSVVQGNSGSSSITSTVTGGFNSAVSLSASGQPTGVTVTFSPSSITGTGSATMNMAVGSTVATGTYPITVTGTSGGTTQTTTVSLTVTAAQTAGFTISVSPSSLTLSRGQNGQATVTAAVSNGFSSTINFTATGVPSGVSVSFSPSSTSAPSYGSVTLNISTSKSAHFGSQTITITGTGGGITQSTPFTLQIKH